MTGKEIKRLRQKIELTQAQMGKLIGVSCATIQRWEKDYHVPSQLAIQRLNIIEKEFENAR